MNMHAVCCAFRGVRVPSVFTACDGRGGRRRREEKTSEREREKGEDGGKREGVRWGGTKMRDAGGRGWAKGDDYCGGGLLICIRKTKGVGRAVCAYMRVCVCMCVLAPHFA